MIRRSIELTNRILMSHPLLHSISVGCRCINHFGKIALAFLFGLFISGCGPQPPYTGPLYPAPQRGAWGYIDNQGDFEIEPRYEAALEFSEGLAGVKREGRWGFIDRTGAEVIPVRHREVQSFLNGVAIVNSGLPENPMGLIDAEGAWVTEPIFRSITAANGPNGLLLGQMEPGAGFGFYDRSGNLVLGPYSLAFPFSEGRARVKAGRNDWIIDSFGTLLSKKPVALEGIRFSQGLIAVRQDQKLGYMDLAGNIAIEPEFDEGGEFSEGLAAVQSKGRWMFVDTSGTVTAELPRNVVFALSLSDGLSLVTAVASESERKLGYVDRNGEWAVQPVWDDAQPFHEGLAYVGTWKDARTAYINRGGRIIWEGRDSTW